MAEAKNQYKSNLDWQANEHQTIAKQEAHDNLAREINHKGFEFECYTRDQLVAQEKQNTTQFVKNQSEADRQRALAEQQARRAAPANLITTDDIKRMNEEQKREQNEQRNHLKNQMLSQYHGSINEKISKREQQRRQDEEQMNRIISENRRIAEEQQRQAREQKQSYGSELKQEIDQHDSARKQQWVQEHDPSLNPHYNLRKVAQVDACENCDAVLGRRYELEEI